MTVQSSIVARFEGYHAGIHHRDALTQRRSFDVPRELLNALVDSYGHLWVPKPWDVLYDFTSAEIDPSSCMKVTAVRGPDGVLTQWGTDVVFVPRDTHDTPSFNVMPPLDSAVLPIWVVSMTDDNGAGGPIVDNYQGGVLYGTHNQTFALRWPNPGNWADSTATELDTNDWPGLVHGRHSFAFRGRRFVAAGLGGGSRRVWFSEINQPLRFQSANDDQPLNYFDVGGDDTGADLGSYIGELRGFAAMEDVLVIFLSQSIWVLTGNSPETFNLRRTQSAVGCSSIETVVPVDEGLMFVGGMPDGEMGVYLFTGTHSYLVSRDIQWYFEAWDDNLDKYPSNLLEDSAEQTLSATRWENQYVLAAPDLDPEGKRQLFVYDLKSKRWSTFGGYTKPRVGNLYALVTGDDDMHLRITSQQMARREGEVAKVTLGWNDEGKVAGHSRFLGLKTFAWRRGEEESDPPTLTVTARVPGDDAAAEVAVDPIDIEEEGTVYDGILTPINLRGHAIEVDLEVTPADGDDTSEIVIEGVELIHSRKGEKLSRV